MEINICRPQVKTKNGIKSDKRLLKAKKAIVSSLIELSSIKEIGDITVTELTAHAKINRKTFYLHYEKIEDVVSDFSDDMFFFVQKTLLETIKKSGGKMDVDLLFDAINSALADNLEFFRALAKSGTYKLFINEKMRSNYINSFRVSLSGNLGSNTHSPYIAEYLASGISAIYVKWLSTELPTVSLEELSYTARTLVSSTLGYYEEVTSE